MMGEKQMMSPGQPIIDILRKEIEAVAGEDEALALMAKLDALENEVLQRIDLLGLDEEIVGGLLYETDDDTVSRSV